MISVRKAFIIAGAILLLGVPVAAKRYTVAVPDEVALTIGEPYDQVLRQSRSTLQKPPPDGFWGGFVTRPATLRFTDAQYGFVTPAAKFFYVSVDESLKVASVTLSPQAETLPLDDAIAVLIDLQDQFRRGGWKPIRVADHPPIANTPAMRALMRKNDAPQSYWLAGDKYQIYLDVRRFRHENRPNDERYLITLQLSGPPLMEE
jgi:hypothetical protein